MAGEPVDHESERQPEGHVDQQPADDVVRPAERQERTDRGRENQEREVRDDLEPADVGLGDAGPGWKQDERDGGHGEREPRPGKPDD